MPPIDTRRGTAIWAFNEFRRDALTNLLDDLLNLEQQGLPDEMCAQVKKFLGHLTNRAASYPDGSFLKGGLWKEFSEFEERYKRWNDHKGSDANKKRRKSLRDLRDQRHRIAKKAREHGHILSEELDLKLVNDIYEAAGELPKALPQVFKGLAGSIRRFNRKKEV
jgi:hypothetical protein